jgi:hypothetical protein
MRKALLISLSLVLALVACTTVCADDGFYVIPTMRGNYAPVPKTGQTTSYAARDDGALQKGVAWPTPRFIDNLNGTVTDKLTGLVWTKNANAFGAQTWAQALNDAATLANGSYGLTDGSKSGDWRLPNIRELTSLGPPFPEGHPFTNLVLDLATVYWSSTSISDLYALTVFFSYGYVSVDGKSHLAPNVWCVRDAK